MNDESKTTLELDSADVGSGEMVLTAWLVDVLKLLNAMAGEGIAMEGCADPADLMTHIADNFGVTDAGDPWGAVVRKMQNA